MKPIKVRAVSKKEVWVGRAKRKASDALLRIEKLAKRHFVNNQSWTVIVDYGNGFTNGGKYDNLKDFMFALTNFLEDYVSRQVMISKLTKYGEFVWQEREAK